MDRPIIFSAPMVRALLDGRKTQTRRVLKPVGTLPAGWPMYASYLNGKRTGDTSNPDFTDLSAENDGKPLFAGSTPYCPGDRLWVRETWADVNTDGGPALAYRAGDLRWCADDAYPVEYQRYPGCSFSMWYGDLLRAEPDHRWRSPIHMPRWASRLTLVVTDVRVERLQDISKADAQAEGVTADDDPFWVPSSADPDSGGRPSHRNSFEFLWDSIHGPAAWDANPWVAAISFTVHRANIDALDIGAAA